MKDNELKMNFLSADELFEPISSSDMLKIEKIVPIPIEKLIPCPKNPFHIRYDEEMLELIDRVSKVGIITPLIVRPKKDGNYEILSGHRRKRAGELLELKEMPCIVRDYDDIQAEIILVSSNSQRENILPSEKAFAYKMLLDAESKQGQRNDLTFSQIAKKLKVTAEEIGKRFGDSKDTVYRLARLTNLLPELLKVVDLGRIKLTPAYDISFLTEDEQYVLLNYYECNDVTPNVEQARELKRLSKEKKLTVDKIEEVLGRLKANQIEKFKFNRDRIKKILPQNIETDKQVEEFIILCIKEHNARVKKRQERDR